MENEKKKVSIVSIIVILVGLLACGFGLYMLFGGKSDKELFISTVEKMPGEYKALSSLSPKMLSANVVDNDNNLKLNANLLLKQGDESESVSLESLVSRNGNVYLKVLNAIDKSFIEALLKDKTAYLSFDGAEHVYSKKLDEEGIPISNEDMEKILTFASKYQNLVDDLAKYIGEEVRTLVNNKELKTEDASITLGGKDTKTKKISLSVSEKDILTIVKNIYDKMSKDENFKELLNMLSSLSGSNMSSEFDVKSILDNFDMLLENADSTKEVFTLSVYRKGNEAVSERVSLKMDESSVDFIVDTYEDSDGNDTFELRVASSGFTAIKVVVTKTDKNKTVINANYLSIINIKMDVESYDDRYSITIKPSSSFGDTEEMGTISLELKEVKKNEEYEFNVSFNTSDSDIKLSGNISSTKEEPSMNISNSVDYEEMTDEEKARITIPGVTAGYISRSKRTSYASTGSEFIKSIAVLVNKGTMPVFDKNTLYLFPVGNDKTKSCIKFESGGKSPFSETYKYAYVGVVYDGASYDYYIISNDGTNHGYRDDAESTTKDYAGKFIISSKRLEAEGGDIVEAGVEENSILNKYYSSSIFGTSNYIELKSLDSEWAAIAVADTESAPVRGGLADFVNKEEINKIVFFNPTYCAFQIR